MAYDINGSETTRYPASAQKLSEVIPIYEEIAGWSKEITVPPGHNDFAPLPEQFQNYISLIERSTGAKVTMVSFGPDRSDTLTVSS